MTYVIPESITKRYKKEITPQRAELISAILNKYPKRINFCKSEIMSVVEERGMSSFPLWLKLWQTDTDLYQLPIIDSNTEIKPVKSSFGEPLTQLNLEQMVEFANDKFGDREVKSSEFIAAMSSASGKTFPCHSASKQMVFFTKPCLNI